MIGKAADTILVNIETPKGSRLKFDFDSRSGHYKLSKVLPEGLSFPFDFGFIPGTIGEDGDPLDVVVISESGTFTACTMECRIIGCIVATQKERNNKAVRNDRFIAVPSVSKLYKAVKDLKDLPSDILQETEQFFVNYNQQAGKKFTAIQYVNASKAIKEIIAAKNEQTPPGQLIQLFIPLTDNQHKPFPKSYFSTIKKKMIREFGGVTVFTRAPVSGLWKDDEQNVKSDEILIFEIMADEINEQYWQTYKEILKKKFKQDEIIIRRSEIGIL